VAQGYCSQALFFWIAGSLMTSPTLPSLLSGLTPRVPWFGTGHIKETAFFF
jgi:hypothetical protein